MKAYREALSKATMTSFPLVGNLSENQKDCGQAAMTESDNDFALLMTLIVTAQVFPFLILS
jgi:hypothetical protein